MGHFSKVQLSRIPKREKFKQSICMCNFSSSVNIFTGKILKTLGQQSQITGNFGLM